MSSSILLSKLALKRIDYIKRNFMTDVAAFLSSAGIAGLAAALTGYGFILLYCFQIGTLLPIGFHYAALTTFSDIWTSAGAVAKAIILITGSALLTAMIVQSLRQAGIDAPNWVVKNETEISGLTGVLLAVAMMSGKLTTAAIILNFLWLCLLVVSFAISKNTIPIWSALFAVIYPLVVSFAVGVQSTRDALRNPKRYDVWLERERLSAVNIVKITSTAILYKDGTGDVAFVLLSKVVKVVPTAD